MKVFRKQYHPPGTPPGTLIKPLNNSASEEVRPLKIDVVNYNKDDVKSHLNCSIDDCAKYVNNNSVTWIHISGGIEPDVLRQLGFAFDLHPLALEDVINHGQRPKVETYDKQLFVIVNMPIVVEKEIHIEQVSLFCGNGYVISFHDQYDENTYQLLHNRLKKNVNHIRNNGSDYLLYVLLILLLIAVFLC
jgi:magnesium transporter